MTTSECAEHGPLVYHIKILMRRSAGSQSDKLIEILGVPEETHLDVKASLDLDSAEDRLNFVKDAVSMSNRLPGCVFHHDGRQQDRHIACSRR
jgi:hypothetical protein